MNDAKVYVKRDNYIQRDVYAYEDSIDGDTHHPYEDGIDSADEDGPVVVRRGVGFHRSSLPPSGTQKYSKQSGSSPSKGYEAFENTNNKKKRKIPTSGGLGSHSSLSSDIANRSCSSGSGASVSLDEVCGQYYGSGNPVPPQGNGISGPGRGRYSRGPARNNAPSARVPLTVHSPNAWSTGRPNLGRRESAPALSQEDIGVLFSLVTST